MSTFTKSQAGKYTHEQATAATTWNIAHKLGMYPVVDVYCVDGGSLQRVMPLEVIYVDVDNCQVTFFSAQSGFAAVA
jgi:hypothetical protein